MMKLSVIRFKFDTVLPGAFRRQRDYFVRKVNRSASLLFVSQGKQPLTNDVLQIRLAYIDHIVDGPSVAERRMIGFTIARGCDPDVRICIRIEDGVLEILGKQSKSPPLIGH